MIRHSDGEDLIMDYYPSHFFEMDRSKPVVVILYGVFGNKRASYIQNICKEACRRDKRVVFLGRRGFHKHRLRTSKVMHEEELKDFVYLVKILKKELNCKIFMCGISAGSCYGARILGKYADEMDVEAYVSISNPYSFSQTCFQMEQSVLGRAISGAMLRNAKELMVHHFDNPVFHDFLNEKRVNPQDLISSLQSTKTMFENDQSVTIKLMEKDHVF